MHRRDFLSSVAGVPALAALQPGQNARPAADLRGLKLGTVTYNIAKDWDLPTLIRNLTEAGFDAVELRTTHRHGVELSLSPAARAEVRKRFEGTPVAIGGVGTTGGYHTPYPPSLPNDADGTKKCVKRARRLR